MVLLGLQVHSSLAEHACSQWSAPDMRVWPCVASSGATLQPALVMADIYCDIGVKPAHLKIMTTRMKQHDRDTSTGSSYNIVYHALQWPSQSLSWVS